ncbi:Scr1 family TA system antitoxin-like transcriptional regulator [Haloactinospora alba]|uniref:Scr1 family TA system antitoxin-like transcriptional regulator n=1 Tax=Haloactinospora alba TaxID=405555 RepID=UPI00114E8D67|nr:Scr1 family TA system antitoxin-like transcriptional regulator [Haloactinospora alba]
MAIESEASGVRMYQPLVIPGLFQTSEYAHALLQFGGSGKTPTELREAVDALPPAASRALMETIRRQFDDE